MPAKVLVDINKEKWVNVTWMPHTTLSQTSHVYMRIRSVHAVLLDYSLEDYDRIRTDPDEWKVRVGVYGLAGLPLIDLQAHTSASICKKRTRSGNQEETPFVGWATHDCFFDCLVTLPVRWRDLPRDAYLLFEVTVALGTVLYRTTMPFFSRYGKLATGLQKLELTRSPLDSSRNYGLYDLKGSDDAKSDEDDDPVWKAVVILDKIQRMEARRRSQQPAISNETFGEIPSVPWLDQKQKARAKQIIADTLANGNDAWLLDDHRASLIVELPVFDIPILHEEIFYQIPQHGTSGAVAPVDLVAYRKKVEQNKVAEETFDPLQLIPFLDYENENDNPVEDKYRTLAHDILRGLVDPALKPDREQRHRLAQIIDSPSRHPTREEKDLLWRFRFSLVENARAVTKFLLAVDWSMESEVVQAAELLEQWRKRSPIAVTDALKLLGKHVAFQTNLVRDYAIETLAAAPDSELRLYLLQLVQALKYENTEMADPSSSRVSSSTAGSPSFINSSPQVSSLATFLINRAANNLELANYLYWYLKVELEDLNYGNRYRDVLTAFEARLSNTPFCMDSIEETYVEDSSTPFKSIVDSVAKLGSTLRKTEKHEQISSESKAKLSKERSMWDVLTEQDAFFSGVLNIQQRCRDSRGKKDAKEAELKSMLLREGYDRNDSREAVPLPSRPEFFVNGVNPETATMFKSALYPALLEFHVEGVMKSSSHGQTIISSGKTEKATKHSDEARCRNYKVIVKTGDDLRQDQLVVMMLQLMDGLLKRAALDLCLTPYSILAMSTSSGFVEFVEGAIPISQILSKYNGSILHFFQTVAFQKGAKYDIRPDVISNYVRSCAGYCVITYILGVGDRHLDNILLRASGHFFHIDFGFIFGRDPKPLPPAFRLTREMVDGMGGSESSEYQQFCSLACQAFNALRKSAGLVLNLLHLMSDAGIEDLSNNPSADVEGVLANVEERFRLDLTDEQAERYFIGLINDCLAAIAPRVMDVFHSLVVARR